MIELFGKQVYGTLEEVADPAHTAVLMVDVQNDFCTSGGHFDQHGYNMTAIRVMIPTLIDFVDKARAVGYKIVWIQQTTLPEGMSDSPAWLAFKTRNGKTSEYTMEGTWGQQFVDGLEPQPNEPIVRKWRSSAFVNTHLDLILRAQGIETVIMTGVMSHGCVEATARHASYLDYYVVYLPDCVASSNDKLHQNCLRLMSFYFPTPTSPELLDGISKRVAHE
jgi:nicotinamidase-related amidase